MNTIWCSMDNTLTKLLSQNPSFVDGLNAFQRKGKSVIYGLSGSQKLSLIHILPVEALNHEHMERIRTERAAELIADTQELKLMQAEPIEGGVSKYAQQPSQLLEHATHEQVHDAFVKAFDGNETMANRYLESKGVRPTEPLQYSVRGKDTPQMCIRDRFCSGYRNCNTGRWQGY